MGFNLAFKGLNHRTTKWQWAVVCRCGSCMQVWQLYAGVAVVCRCGSLIHQIRTWTSLKMTDKKYLPSAGFCVVFPIQITYEPVLHETCFPCRRCDPHIRQYLPLSPAVIPNNIRCQIVVRCLPKARKNNPVYTDIIFFVKLICSYCVWFGPPLELQYKLFLSASGNNRPKYKSLY